MSSHVILLTDAHEAPAYELIEALRAAGVKTLIEGLREVEVEAAITRKRKSEGTAVDPGPPPLAVLYEVVPGADMVELHTAIDHCACVLARCAVSSMSSPFEWLSNSQFEKS
jgi:hypothetical protein